MQAAPQTLAEYFGIDEVNFHLVDPSSFAHVIIDVQRIIADPSYPHGGGSDHTDAVAKKIASLQQPFRDAGVQTIIVFLGQSFEKSFGGPHHISRAPNDIVFGKETDSAFENLCFPEMLAQRGIKRLLVSGFNARACVKDTVVDSIPRGLKTVVMPDLIGQDKGTAMHRITGPWKIPTHINDMVESGAASFRSAAVLVFLAQINAARTRDSEAKAQSCLNLKI